MYAHFGFKRFDVKIVAYFGAKAKPCQKPDQAFLFGLMFRLTKTSRPKRTTRHDKKLKQKLTWAAQRKDKLAKQALTEQMPYHASVNDKTYPILNQMEIKSRWLCKTALAKPFSV